MAAHECCRSIVRLCYGGRSARHKSKIETDGQMSRPFRSHSADEILSIGHHVAASGDIATLGKCIDELYRRSTDRAGFNCAQLLALLDSLDSEPRETDPRFECCPAAGLEDDAAPCFGTRINMDSLATTGIDELWQIGTQASATGDTEFLRACVQELYARSRDELALDLESRLRRLQPGAIVVPHRRGTPAATPRDGVGDGFPPTLLSSDGTPRRATPRTSVGIGLAGVGGMQELKRLLNDEVIAPLRNPEEYRRYGLTIPNGILLYGPPGCGKTFVAHALADELGYRWHELTAGAVASSYVHETVRLIRDIFDRAARTAPAMIFCDEFDAMAADRSQLRADDTSRQEEVTELLIQLNECAQRRVLVVAATNLPSRIDPAVLRPGRFDRQILIDLPDLKAREEILRLHLNGRFVSDGLATEDIARRLEGYSGADIKMIVDAAALAALRLREPISDRCLHGAIAQRRPSVTPEDRARFTSIASNWNER